MKQQNHGAAPAGSPRFAVVAWPSPGLGGAHQALTARALSARALQRVEALRRKFRR